MSITINSAENPTVSPAENSSQPSAPLQPAEINVDLDASYPSGGYDLSEAFAGAKVGPSPYVPSYDGSALYWLHVVDDGGTPKLMVHDSANGAPGAETSTADQSGHTGKNVLFFYK